MVFSKKVSFHETEHPLPAVSTISLPSWKPLEVMGIQNGVVKTHQEVRSKVVLGPDSGLSWAVAAACFVYTFVTIGLSKTNAVIFVEYLKISHLSREIAAWPFSVAGLAIIFVGPMIGVATRHVSPRYLSLIGAVTYFLGTLSGYFTLNIYSMIFLFGALRGVGVAVAVVLTPPFINQYFHRHRATAQGIVGAGNSVGVLVFLLAVNYGVEEYALRGTILLLAAVSLNAVPVSWFLNPPPWLPKRITRTPKQPALAHDNHAFEPEPEMNVTCPDVVQSAGNHYPDHKTEKSQEKSTLLRDLKDIIFSPMFLLVTFSYSMVINAGLMFSMIVVDYAEDIGIPKDKGIYIMLAFSFGEFLGKIGLGWVTDKKFLSLQGYFAVATSLAGCIHFGIPFFEKPDIILLCGSFGVAGALQGSTQGYVTLFFDEYLVNKDCVQLALSLFLPGSALFALARPPIIGFFRDGMGSYDNLFRFVGVTLFLASSVWTVERIYTHIHRFRSK